MLTRRLLVFGYPLIEILLLWLVASIVGWLAAILLLIAGLPAGAALMRNAAAKYLSAREVSESERASVIRSSTGMFLSGLLIMIPGFLTDIIGILLLIPPIQRLALSRVGAWTQARMVRVPGFTTYAYGQEVIQGVVIEEFDHEKGEEPPDSSPEISR